MGKSNGLNEFEINYAKLLFSDYCEKIKNKKLNADDPKANLLSFVGSQLIFYFYIRGRDEKEGEFLRQVCIEGNSCERYGVKNNIPCIEVYRQKNRVYRYIICLMRSIPQYFYGDKYFNPGEIYEKTVRKNIYLEGCSFCIQQAAFELDTLRRKAYYQVDDEADYYRDLALCIREKGIEDLVCNHPDKLRDYGLADELFLDCFLAEFCAEQ